MHECALHTLPKLRVSSSGVPGWNYSARHLKDKANFWYNVWNSAGSPSSGVLFQIKKSSKSRYKYEVRRLKRQEFHIRRKRLASALALSHTRDFWQEVKHIHKPKCPSGSVSTIDGIQDAHGIANTFASKVSSYLNTHDPHPSGVLLSFLSSTISKVDTASFSISIECVRSAFSKLKLSKSDGSLLVSDHLIMCLPVIAEPLSVLFTAMIRHSFMPKLFRDCTLVPIPKNGKDPNFSDSYRAIALAPTLSKALEWCLLLQYPDQFSTSDLQFGFSKLKLSKSDGSLLVSDHLIMCLPVIAEPLSVLFTAMIRHSFMPKLFRDCTLVPIPKNGKDPNFSDSYRAIALAPTLSKALEWCLLLQYPDQFSTSDLQFGFKRFISTSLCTGTVKNVAHRYVRNGSPVFGYLLDSSKAFDLVRHDILFDRLLQRHLPPLIISFLLNWYKSQELCVKWGGIVSDAFSVANGVCQGGVLSPVLFTIYMDELLLQLKHNAIGCHWDHLFAGALCYADDLILLAPSLSALRLMLSSCESFSISHGLKFNASKIQLIRFGSMPSSDYKATVYFCGSELQFVNTVTHLGHVLAYNLSDSTDIVLKTRDMVKKANCLLCSFTGADPATLTHLFRSFCLSLHGAALWNLSNPTLCSLEVAFNNILRKLWRLPFNCHTRILHLTARLKSLYNVIFYRSRSFLCSATSKCPSSLVRAIFSSSASLCYTSVGYNSLYGISHLKQYFLEDAYCAAIVRDLRLFGSTSWSNEHIIRTISSI